MEFRSRIDGFKEAEKLLKQLPERTQNRVLQAAVTSGAREVRKAVKAAAPQSTDAERSPASKKYGRLRDNIRVIRLRRVPRGTKAARVDMGNAFWGLILALGSRYIPANPWFSNAFNGATAAGFAKMRDTLVDRIEKEAVKLANETGANKKR